MNWKAMGTGLFVAVALLATSASAQMPIRNGAILHEKLTATRTLVLEEGERLRVDQDTVITQDGNRISFSEIPEPADLAGKGSIMVEWTGLQPDGNASSVNIRLMLR